MARKRAYKKRADYRKGGRVNFEKGSAVPEDDPDYNRKGKGPIGKVLGAIGNAVKFGGQTNQMWDGRAPVSTSKAVYTNPNSTFGQGAPVSTSTPTYNPNYANTFNTLNPVAGGQSSSGTVYNPATADLGRTGAFDVGSTGVAGGTAVTGGAGSGQGASTDATQKPVTPAYTQADVDQAVADLNAGKITAADLAAQYGVTEDYVNKNLAVINAQSGGTKTLTNPATGQTMDVLANDPRLAGMTDAQQVATVFNTPPAAAPAASTTIPPITDSTIAAIPADGKYTQAETQQVVDALNAGTITSAQAADQFGSTIAQVEAELARQNQQAAGQTVTTPDPFPTVGGVGGVQAATRPTLLKRATDAQIDSIDLKKKDDPKTVVDESKQEVPGAILKDYTRVDPNLLFDDRVSKDLNIESGITKDVDIKKLDDYVDIDPPTGVDKNTFSSAIAEVTKAAKAGILTPANYNAALVNILNTPQYAQNRNRPPITVNEINQLTERAETAQFSADQLKTGLGRRTTDVGLSDASFVEKVEPRGQTTLSPTKEAEKQTREAITGTAATSDAAKITDTIDYDSYKRREVTGVAAKDAAVQFTAQTANIPANLARTMVEDPAKVEAQIDNESPEVIAAVAALPQEALVSSQMETLLAGMESGAIPAWAKPAYDAVNQNMAQRGIDSSTVGRDALFNAIIQSAIPIAQSNAQALQTRAAQNLSNEQQANLQRSQLDATRRMNNLANRQTAESQSAQFAQNLNVLQSQFSQERDTLSANQQQQVRLQNLQNQQRTAELNAQNEAASRSQNLGNEQQIEIAELQIKNQTEQQNMTAENQERLVKMQVSADFLSKNAGFAQQMQLANLSSEQQMELANLTAKNQADAQSLTAGQQTELANLNARMQTNLAQAQIAERMGVALLNADQQRAVQNAATVARMDLTKFNDAQQIELANSKFMQTASLTDFNARQQSVMQNATALAGLDIATADQRTKLAITQAQNFLSRDMANLSNEQQALILDTQVEQQRLLSDQASTNAARQFNATSDNQINQFNQSLATQIEQFNATQSNAMEQFNKAEENRVAAINAGNAIDAAKFNNQIDVQIKTFNEQADLQRDQWNASNGQAVEQSNIEWRRKANTIDTASTNATNQENAGKAFQISAADQAFIWQELRDEATYLRTSYENDQQRKTTLYATSLANEGQERSSKYSTLIDLVDGIFNQTT